MEHMIVEAGSTDVTTYVHLWAVADHSDITAATITDIDLQYVRAGAAPSTKVDAIALGAVDAAHADNKAIAVDGTDQPGLYRVDWPDAAFAAGVGEVILSVKYATAFTVHIRVELSPSVHLDPTQPAITWGQQKIVADADGEGALDIRNSNAGGIGLYNYGAAIGQQNYADATGGIGMNNYGEKYGVYNAGLTNTSGVGTVNYGYKYGEQNKGGTAGQYNDGGTYGQLNDGTTAQSSQGTSVDVDPDPSVRQIGQAEVRPVSS